jgi:LEA14-like dessication related protein
MALWLAAILTLCLASGTGGASLGLGSYEPEVYLVNVTPLSGTAFEQRVRVDLRLRNPNRREIPFNGLDFVLDVNGEPMARGYNSEGGILSGYGEQVVSVDANTTVLDLIRQFGVLNDRDRKRRGYELRGRLHLAGAFRRSVDFSSVY